MFGKYTLLFHDGIGPMFYEPEPPCEHNTTNSLAQARRMFAQWLRDTRNDYARAPGYGAPWCDVVWTSNWDGISYGDITGGDGVCRFVMSGPRGGIVRENF